MKIDISRVRSLQERETAGFYKQRAENEGRVEKIAHAVEKYPDIGKRIGVEGIEFSYKTMVPEAYKPIDQIDKPTLRIQTEKLQDIVNKYNAIVLEEYEKAVQLQEEADKIIGAGG